MKEEQTVISSGGRIAYTIFPELRIVHFQGFGRISYTMIIEHIALLHGDPKWDFGYNTLIDFEDAEVIPDVDNLNRYEDYFSNLQEKTPPRKWAIYTRHPITHQSANMSHLLASSSIEVDVFQNRDDALIFLGVSPETFRRASCRIASV